MFNNSYEKSITDKSKTYLLSKRIDGEIRKLEVYDTPITLY